MKDAPNIQGVTVQLNDGRWQYFSASDLATARDYTEHKIWRLLEFITSLAPPVAPECASSLPTPPPLTEDAHRSKGLPDKELPSTPENGSTDPRPYWLIYYEDSDVAPEVFTDEQAARERFASRLASWGCQLFRQIEHGLALTESSTKPDVGGGEQEPQ